MGVLGEKKLSTSRQCAPVAKKTNGILVCIGKSIASRLRGSIVPLCSALMRPHLKYCTQSWALQYKRDMDIPEQVQFRTVKIVKGQEHLTYEEMLRAGIV